MSKSSTKAAIGAAVVTAAGGIVAAIITIHGHGTPTPTPTPAPTSSPVPVATSSAIPGPTQTPEAGTIQTVPGETFDYVYSEPTGDLVADRVGEVSNGTNVNIICTVQGPAVASGDTLWDKIAYNSGSAYISDYYVYTGTNQAVMPSC